MFKRVLKILGVVGVLAAIGAGVAWHVVSNKALDTAKQKIEALNARVNAKGATTKFSYRSMERTGFPKTGLSIVDPSYELTIPASGQNQPPLQLSAKTQGTVVVTTDYFGHAYEVQSNAGYTMDVVVGDKKHSLKMDAYPLTLMVQAKDGKAFEDWSTLDTSDPEQVKAAFKGIAAFNMDAGTFTLKEAATGATVMTSEKTQINITNRSTDTLVDFDARGLVKAYEIKPLYTQLMNDMMRGFGQQPLSIQLGGDTPFASERAGKIDFDADLGAYIPLGADGKPTKNGMKVNLRKFAMKNNFYVLDMPSLALISEEGGTRRTALKLGWSFEMLPAAAKEAELITKIIGQKLTPAPTAAEPATQGAAAPAVSADIAAKLQEKLMAALPNMTSLGPVTLSVDMEAALPIAAQNANTQLTTIRDFSLNHKRWGIDARGMSKQSSQSQLSVDMLVNCLRCNVLTRDVLGLAIEVQDVIAVREPTRPRFTIDNTLMANLNQLLADIGTKDAASGDIAFDIKTPQPGDIRVNGKPMKDVMMKLMAFATPAMTQAAPVSAPPPVAAPSVPASPAPAAVPAPASPASPQAAP